MTPIVFDLVIKTKNSLNGNFGNSRKAALAQARTDAAQRDLAHVRTIAAFRRAGVHPAELVPFDVTLTRFSSGHLDGHDGVQPPLKRIVDGIAKALGVDDGGPFVAWHYQQAKAPPGVQGVRVRIEKQQGSAGPEPLGVVPMYALVLRPEPEAVAVIEVKRKRRPLPPDEVA